MEDFFSVFWTKEYNKFYYKKMKEYEYNSINFSLLLKLHKTINRVKKVYFYSKKYNCSVFKSINDLNYLKHKTTIYSYFDKLKQIGTNFEKLELVPTIPKKIKYVYDDLAREKVLNMFFNQKMNFLNIACKMRLEFGFKKITLATITKWVKQDKRFANHLKKNKKLHPLRTYNIPFGNIQMDLKIIGPKESPTGKQITIFDAKDCQSKLLFLKVIPSQHKNIMLKTTKQMINFFENKIGMKILTVQTDNAMLFKNNNFVHNDDFNNLLKNHNIEHRFIKIGEPQSNGVIERHHKTLDDEVIKYFSNQESFLSIKTKMEKWADYHNFKRHHYYSFINSKTYWSKIFIPFDYFKKNIFT